MGSFDFALETFCGMTAVQESFPEKKTANRGWMDDAARQGRFPVAWTYRRNDEPSVPHQIVCATACLSTRPSYNELSISQQVMPRVTLSVVRCTVFAVAFAIRRVVNDFTWRRQLSVAGTIS